MNTKELLTELQQSGVTLTLVGDRLRWRGPQGAMTPALKDALVANKAEVRRLLKGGQDLDAPGAPRGGSNGAKRGATGQPSPSAAQGKPADLQTRMEALLAELKAATGCPDAQAEKLLGRWALLEREAVRS